MVTETANGFFLPVICEVVTLQQLHQREGQYTDGEVETVGRELSTWEMIEPIVGFELADHLLKLPALVVEVNDGLSIFLLFGDIGGDDPVVIVAVKEIGLMASSGPLDDQAEGLGRVLHRMNGLGDVIRGGGSIIIFPLFPGCFGDASDCCHHGHIMVSGDGKAASVGEAIVDHRVVVGSRVRADG